MVCSCREADRPRHAYVASLLVALALLGLAAVASAASGFTERVASARWSTPFLCPDGSTAPDGRLIVETDNFIEAGTTPDPNPPLRVGFTGQCPDGTYSGASPGRRHTRFDSDLREGPCQRHVHRRAGQPGRDAHGSVDARGKGTGPATTTVNAPGSWRRERSATATARIVFDGSALVDGPANFPFPAPFIRIDRGEVAQAPQDTRS